MNNRYVNLTAVRYFEQGNRDTRLAKIEPDTTWCSPLPNCDWSLPLGKQQPGGFGTKQKFNFHTGVDLLCKHLQPLAAVEAGTIVSLQDFSKNKNKQQQEQNNNPRYNNTRVILIEGKTGVVAYCNVKESENIKVGMKVNAGDIIGNVVRVNKNKRENDICMLHLELHEHGTRKRVTWSFVFPKPVQLLDPTEHLVSIITNSKTTKIYKRRSIQNI
jgi:hypothetical protein